MRRIIFILGWLLVLAMAQASLNPTIGLLAVVACAVHIGLVLGRRGRAHKSGFSLGAVLWLARLLVSAPLGLPIRLLRRRRHPSQVESIGIEVHLADRRRSISAERRLRTALRQCARTWAPHALPVDRITVHAGASPAGRAQVYDQWLPTEDPQQRSSASLAVISLGLLDATGRPLDDLHLAGVLATQVAALVAERYQRQHADVPATGSVENKPSLRPSRLPAANLVDPTNVDAELRVLMDRLRRPVSPLEAESTAPATAND
jgi:hypothetical protein